MLVESVGPFFIFPHSWKPHVFLGSSASPGKWFLKPEGPHKKRTYIKKEQNAPYAKPHPQIYVKVGVTLIRHFFIGYQALYCHWICWDTCVAQLVKRPQFQSSPETRDITTKEEYQLTPLMNIDAKKSVKY